MGVSESVRLREGTVHAEGICVIPAPPPHSLGPCCAREKCTSEGLVPKDCAGEQATGQCAAHQVPWGREVGWGCHNAALCRVRFYSQVIHSS